MGSQTAEAAKAGRALQAGVGFSPKNSKVIERFRQEFQVGKKQKNIGNWIPNCKMVGQLSKLEALTDMN